MKVGREFKVMPGALKVELTNAVLALEGRLVGPSLEEWNPKKERWPVGSCAYGETKCAAGVDPEESRSMYSLLHIANSRNVTSPLKCTTGPSPSKKRIVN